MTIYNCYITIKINCAGIIQHISCPITITAKSYDEAKKVIKENTTFKIEEPIELIHND